MSGILMSVSSPEILRRLQFVLEVARAEDKSSQDLKMVLRVLSNIATLGRDVGSSAVYRLNKNVSVKALEALSNCGEFGQWVGDRQKNFRRQVMNEHQMPLEDLVREIKNQPSMNCESLWSLLTEYPMVTILVEEDQGLRDKSRGESNPLARYKEAGIEIIRLPVGAYEYWQKNVSVRN